MDNFVDVVGYQFERVHTGVISWILDTKNMSIPMDTKYEVLRRIYRMCHRNIDFRPNELERITCTPEYSFGRRRKIDLVVKIDLLDRAPKYLVFEMKVDSIPTSEQLQGTRNDFIRANACEPTDLLFLLFLFGSSQVCSLPDLYDFVPFGLPYILEVFAGLHIDQYVYHDWIDSLRSEEMRRTCIQSEVRDAPQIGDKVYWSDRGYRPWFSLFYYIYSELRQHSRRCNEWDIYSGNNNPVMNWRHGLLDKNIAGQTIQFYWEFNYEGFVLKVMWDENNKLSKDDLRSLRDRISLICDRDSQHTGRRAQNRYGTYNSLYKWTFDLTSQTFDHIMNEVDSILDVIHPQLSSL